MAKTVEQELMAVTGIKKQKERQRFLAALVEAIEKLSDDQWKGLTTEAQNWYNAASEAYNQESPIADFVGEASPADEVTKSPRPSRKPTADSEESENTEEKTVAKKAAKKAAAKPSANGKAKPKASAKVRTGEGAPVLIKRIVLKNPETTTAQLCEQLKKKGLKVSAVTVSSIRSQFRHSVRMLQEAGLVKESLKV